LHARTAGLTGLPISFLGLQSAFAAVQVVRISEEDTLTISNNEMLDSSKIMPLKFHLERYGTRLNKLFISLIGRASIAFESDLVWVIKFNLVENSETQKLA